MSAVGDFDVIIAGAGIVGMSTALSAQKAGLRVLICDANPPGSGATYGCACTLATYACLPVNSPSILTSLPHLLFGQDSPLSFNFRYGLKRPRWMLSFLNNCRPSRVRHITQALAGVLKHADAGLNPLLQEADAEDLIVRNDCLYVWSTRAGYQQAQGSTDVRRAHGVSFTELSAEDIRHLEPNLRMPLYAGLRFDGVRHVTDPQKLVARMHQRFEALGGTYVAQNVLSCTPDDQGVTVRLGDETLIRAGHFVLSAGARSDHVQGIGAEAIPLGAERGYHIQYRGAGHLISCPIGWAEAGFYATPMAEGLRLAGTVEVDAVEAPPNPKRIAYLHRKSHEMFGDLGAPDDSWLGHRPTVPDSLPVIGSSPVSDRAIFAFGHQHIGLTLGGVTGNAVTDLVLGNEPVCDLSDFAPGRFM